MDGYRIVCEAIDCPDCVKQGKAYDEGITEKDVDPKELAMGIDVEKEHTDNPELAKRIALDHLAEIPDYYTRLDKMEKEAGVDHHE
jgi:hypothetical protein